MRGAAVLALAILALTSPTFAQPAAPDATEVEQRVASALGRCITDRADVAALEAEAVAAGWPVFEDLDGRDRQWRVSSVRERGRIVESLGISAGAYPPAPVSANILSCKIVTATAHLDAVRRGVTAATGDENVNGFYYLESGALRSLTILEMLTADFPEMIANIPQGQRLVIVTLESERRTVTADVSVFGRVE